MKRNDKIYNLRGFCNVQDDCSKCRLDALTDNCDFDELYEACMEYGFGKDICELILLHHGTHKYRTLTDEQISDFAKEYFQILMAADIYDALISDRVYRKAIDHNRALDIVAENPEIKRWVFLALEKISLC